MDTLNATSKNIYTKLKGANNTEALIEQNESGLFDVRTKYYRFNNISSLIAAREIAIRLID